jgi:Domain of unknown function (DUF4136)
MKPSTLLRFSVFLLCVIPCTAQKVTITVDKAFDFKSAKRYAWGQNKLITRQGAANDALINERIVAEVNSTLAAKGFIEDRANPDFYVSYNAGSSDPSLKMEGAYSPASPASTAVVQPIYGIPQNVWYSVDGHVTFHIIDSKSNKAVWSALATKKIHDPHKGMKDMPKQVQTIVSKTFKNFPPNVK